MNTASPLGRAKPRPSPSHRSALVARYQAGATVGELAAELAVHRRTSWTTTSIFLDVDQISNRRFDVSQ